MKTNFKIEDNIAVEIDGIYIDLHNNFEFQKIIEVDNNVQITFIKRNEGWVHEKEFRKLKFFHKKVTYKYFENGKNSVYPEDENTLSTITFFPIEMRDINDGFIFNKISNENDDIIYFFENEKLFRINCEEIVLIPEN